MESSIKLNQDSCIFESVKEIITKYHPYLSDRLDVLFSHNRPEMDIKIFFYEEDAGVKTQIMFIDGKRNYKHSLEDTILIDGEIDKNELNKIIRFLYDDHGVISEFFYNEDIISLFFKVDIREGNMQGLGIGDIELNLDFTNISNHEEQVSDYLQYIIYNNAFYLKDTTKFKEEYNKYCNRIKRKFLESNSKEELMEFINDLPVDTIKDIIFNMNNDNFMEHCKTHFEEENSRLIRKRA